MGLKNKFLTGLLIGKLALGLGSAGAIGVGAAGIGAKATNFSDYHSMVETKQTQQVESSGLEEKMGFLDIDRSIAILQYILSAHDSIPPPGVQIHVDLYIPRNPPGPGDTAHLLIWTLPGYYTYAKYIYAGANLNAQPGETLYAHPYYDDTSGRYESITYQELQDGGNLLPPLFFDDPKKPTTAYTIFMKDISDTNYSTQALDLFAINWPENNPWQKDTVPVDTLSNGTGAHPQFYDFYWNTEKQDSAVGPGSNIVTLFGKISGDSIYPKYVYTNIGPNNTHGNAVDGGILHYFPENYPVRNFGLEQIVLPDTVDSGSVVTPKILVRNDGIISPWPAYITIDGYADSTQQVLFPGYDTINFSSYTFNAPGNNVVSCSLGLDGDINPLDDTLSKVVHVRSTGISEHKNIEPRTQFRASPTILKGNNRINVSGLDGYLGAYNSIGQQLDEYKIYGTAILDFSKYPAGVYFLKPEEPDLPPVKIVKTK